MGQGLGKNSPLVLSLGKENYEALIDRHGQWVRWRVARKCPCVNALSMQPDLKCKKCNGLGYVYGFQKQATITQTVMLTDTDEGVIELDTDYSDMQLEKCYDNSGREYPNAEKVDNYVFLNSSDELEKGVYVTAVMTENVLKRLEYTTAYTLGNGYYRVEGLRVSHTAIDGLFHTAASDIENIGKVEDAEGNEYEVGEKRQDCIYIKPRLDDEGNALEAPQLLKVYDVDYIPPFTFVLLNQNLSETDFASMRQTGGDAILTFPYAYDVAEDDVITVLSGTFTKKAVIARKNAEYDVIPAYFVDSIVQCTGKNREYALGVDFLLCGANYLKWLCEDAPAVSEAYSITYKAVVKLFETYGEARGVNKQA